MSLSILSVFDLLTFNYEHKGLIDAVQGTGRNTKLTFRSMEVIRCYPAVKRPLSSYRKG